MTIRAAAYLALSTLLASSVLAAPTWQQVVGPGAVTPAGFGDPGTFHCVDLVPHDGWLWAVAATVSGETRVWRSADGTVWIPAGEIADRSATDPLAVLDGRLYLATDSEVWRLGDDGEWTAVGPDLLDDVNTHATALGAFRDRLYLGVETADDATEIWSAASGGAWQVETRLEPDPDVLLIRFGIGRMEVLGDRLYVESRWFQPSIDFDYHGSDLLRSPDGTTFELAKSFTGGSSGDGLRALTTWNGEVAAGVGYARYSGAEVWRTTDGGALWHQVNEDGFGGAQNFYVTSLAGFGGALYAGTENPLTGGEVWRTADGSSWEQVNEDGFGASANVSVTAMEAFGGRLYAATTDNQGGVLVWRLDATPRYLMGVAHLDGAQGTVWRSDVELCHLGDDQARVEVAALWRGGDNRRPPVRTVSLDAGTCRRFEDVLPTLFGAEGAATLRIWAPTGVVTSQRTYTLGTDGTYGSFLTEVAEATAVVAGERTVLAQLSHAVTPQAGFRTNCSFANLSGQDLTIDLAVHRADGSLLGTLQVQLEPYGYRQLDRVFAQVTDDDVADGYLVASTATPGGRFLAAASVVDNLSGDVLAVQGVELDALRPPSPVAAAASPPDRGP